jgi:hypothetical protein
MGKKLTKTQAEAAFMCIVGQFKADIEAGYPMPVLVEDHDWGSPDSEGNYPWGILWEEGPEEWALRAGGAVEWPENWPKDVYLEAANHWSVRLYPADPEPH